MLTAINQAVVAIDLDRTVTFWNPSAEALFGWPADDAIGQDILDLTTTAATRETRTALIQRVAAGERWSGELLCRRRDGSTFPALVTGGPIRDTDGHVTGAVGSVVDLSDRYDVEEQLRQSQKMESIGRLAGGIAHDFNNLLTVIRGHSELLGGAIDSADPKHEGIRQIQEAARRATALTRQLLAFSRKQDLQPRLLSLDQCVIAIEPMLRRLIGEDVEILLHLNDSGSAVMADPGQLDHVLINLAVNARDAMPDGGTLAISTSIADMDANYLATHTGAVAGSYVMLAVSDTGCGMSRETSARIFEPFFTTKPPGQGTGLGLSTVYGIVKHSGGYIWVYSELDAGTTFKIYLPRIASTLPPVARPGIPPAAPRGGTETVLIVEDDLALRNLTRRILAEYGYNVLDAANGREALHLAAHFDGVIDLVVTDVIMPEMSGRALVEQLSLMRPGSRSLYMSGYTDDDVVRRGMVSDHVAFLQKPFTASTLLRVVRKTIDGEPLDDAIDPT